MFVYNYVVIFWELVWEYKKGLCVYVQKNVLGNREYVVGINNELKEDKRNKNYFFRLSF